MRQSGHLQGAQQVLRHPEREPAVPRRAGSSRPRHGTVRRGLEGRPRACELGADRQRLRVHHRALDLAKP
eukprot:6161326-Heterocapsa_arctica.AAC.1